jgi:hypothetical protein
VKLLDTGVPLIGGAKNEPEILDFVGLGGPGGPGNSAKRWGASPPPDPRLIFGGSRPLNPSWGAAAPQTLRCIFGGSAPQTPQRRIRTNLYTVHKLSSPQSVAMSFYLALAAPPRAESGPASSLSGFWIHSL